MPSDLSGSVTHRQDLRIAVGTVVTVALLLAVGWAFKNLEWRTIPTATGGDIGEGTDPGQAGRLIQRGERILVDRNSGSRSLDRIRLPAPASPPGSERVPAGAIDPETERRLAEARRRVDEDRRRREDLAREAEFAPLGQSLHPMGAWSAGGRRGDGPPVAGTALVQSEPETPEPISRTGFVRSPEPRVGANPTLLNGRHSRDGSSPRPAPTGESVTGSESSGASAVRVGQIGVSDIATIPSEPPGSGGATRAGFHRLFAGTVIPAVLLTAIDSGLPGLVRAQVVADVRDSGSGTRILIPRGAFLIGRYGKNGNVHAERLFVGWQAVQFPDGTSRPLGSAATSDIAGVAGLPGTRQSRFLKTLGTAFAINLVGAMTDNGNDAMGSGSGSDPLAGRLRHALGDTVRTTSETLIERDLDAAPVFRIAAGTPMNVVLENDLWLPAD
ncbi:MAG: hypothetical protein OXL68_03455 [Paracoccaceae bacterium]|nr:hypothetical protein [Paracoccaceae bacterium]